MNDIIKKIRNQLEESIDVKTKENSQGFFKEKIDSYGVKVPVVNKISKDSPDFFTVCHRKNAGKS